MPELSVSPTLDLTRNDRGPEPRTSGAPPAPGRFICFEGIDGAGKTTIAKAVAERLLAAGRPVLYLEKKCPRFPSSFLQHHMQIVGTALWHSPKGSPIGTLGDDHWLHLMVSWFAALDHSCVRPALANGRFIVTDNWYYKFIARFAAKPSYTLGDLEHCFARISVPTDVIMLDVAPEVAAGRRLIGCRKLAHQYPQETFWHEAGHDRFTTDCDTPEAYQRLLQSLAQPAEA